MARGSAAPTLWLPIFNYADGYGLTYGLRAAFADVTGEDSRISFPLSWGGERRAGVELERSFNDQRTRAGVAFWVNRRVNPHFDLPDLRQQVRFEADHAIVNWLRVGASARVANVDFGDDYSARHTAAGAYVTFDTRIDPSFPRNAVHTRIGWERVAFESGDAGRFSTDARGYVGIGGSAVLALRGQLARSDAPLPAAEQSLLGGADTLRGYRAGHLAGDSLAAVSAEVRLPLDVRSELRALRREGLRGCGHDVGLGHEALRSTLRARDRRRRLLRRHRLHAESRRRVARGRKATRAFRTWA